ncbi:MAG: hypothetical protein IPM89_01985 [Candidatus Competibacteraceae bacterium]|nr:MAG: hypothetical protein IPM89_01985 [Candidatus Competibacteraceae bacterium]
MRSLRRLTGFAELLLLAVVLVGWGGSSDAIRFDGSGGGGFTGGGFTGRAPITVGMTADKTTLPVNILNAGPSIGNPYTNTVTVQVMQNGKLFAAPLINVAIASGLSSGALYYLDGDSEHEQCPTGATCPPTATVPIAFRNITFEDTQGIVTFHVNATNIPGTIVLVASAQDPQTGQVISGNLTITVTGGGGGATGGFPSVVKFVMDPALVYIRDNPSGTTTVTQNTVKQFQVFVLDDFSQPINQGEGHALRVELLPNRPNGGEWLSTTDANGNPQEGTSVLANLVGGVATLVLHSGTLPGTVLISATADRRDNNVDNGIEMGITNYAMVSIGTGEIKSLTFTGPFADAAFVSANNLIAVNGLCPTQQACDFVWDGVYNRIISVIASDPFGNPPPEGTPITFRLIDSPLDMLVNRYPDQGHGQFAITGYNGDPQEGSWEFFAPNRTVPRAVGDTLNPFVVPNGVSYAVADPLCLLMLQDPEIINPNPSTINALPAEGRLEYHVGSRVITGRSGNMLTVNTPFNQVSQNVGANVWYTVGCPPHKGNVLNIGNGIVGNEVIVLTDVTGRASTVMSYPASQVGRRFMVAAESNGGKVGAVMTHWYLGNPDGSFLTITQPPQLAQQVAVVAPIDQNPPALVTVTQEVPSGIAVELPVTLQLLDGGVTSGGVLVRTPIPGVPIAVQIVINDPSEAAAIAAEEAVVKAQVALDTFDALNPGVCDLIDDDGDPDTAPVERDPAKCAERKALVVTLDAAKIAAAQARAIANLHTPTASVVPATLASGAGGYTNLVLQVNDLPTDGSVDFFFSTVGPEISSETLQITVQPPQPEAAATQ